MVPELPRSPQEARQPQPQLQRPGELAAARPSVPADPHPGGAAVHHVRGPGGINAFCPALLLRQRASAFPLRVVLKGSFSRRLFAEPPPDSAQRKRVEVKNGLRFLASESQQQLKKRRSNSRANVFLGMVLGLAGEPCKAGGGGVVVQTVQGQS